MRGAVDLFAYVSLGLCGLMMAVGLLGWAVELLRDPLGRAIVAVGLGVLLAWSGLFSAVWLLVTKT